LPRSWHQGAFALSFANIRAAFAFVESMANDRSEFAIASAAPLAADAAMRLASTTHRTSCKHIDTSLTACPVVVATP
jgi:hypothetical protein